MAKSSSMQVQSQRYAQINGNNRGNKQGDGSVIEEAKMEEETTQTVAPTVELKRVNTDGLGGPNLRKA